ncbi:MAG: hypothetical protein RL538_204 [Candidatus Parcubacteria bacterium]|jgi:hypothetical protein
MKERQKRMYDDYKYALGLGLLILACVCTIQLVVQERLSNLEETLLTQIHEQEELLTAIAKATAINGVDTSTEGIISDCSVSERSEFDVLLGRLDSGLSQTELTKLDRLFGRCGDFFAERKSLMVARLAREVMIYADLVEQLGVVTSTDESETFKVESWRTLADEEAKQAELFASLVNVQDSIIAALLSGKSPKSEEIKTILREAQETQGMLIVTSKQAASVRDTLLPL